MYFADFIEKYMRRKRYGTPYTKIRENYEKNITLRYLLIVVVIKYSLLNTRWRKPEIEVIQSRQLYMNIIL